MKHHLTLAALLLAAPLARADLSIPSDGSDGALAITGDTVIDLSQAVTGNWNDNNTANAGKGIYDPNKWAVVFKYSSVDIPGNRVTDPNNPTGPQLLIGRKVTFINHPSGAPVVWLVQGGVNIRGIVDVTGKPGSRDAVLNLSPALGGPGGYRGGASGPSGWGTGLGIGGADQGNISTPRSYGRYSGAYGNPQIIPLMGGSGGGPSYDFSGSGGGGAILIAAAGTCSITGLIDARGGKNDWSWGSGGAIKIIANQVTGTGSLTAVDTGAQPGRIRIETPSMGTSLVINPSTVAVPPANPPQIWPGATAPTVRVVSIDGVAAPADPTARLDTASDVAIAKNTAVDVIIQTTNFPTSGVVQVRDVKKFQNQPLGSAATWTNCTLHGTGNTFAQSNWKATITFSGGFTTLQARATVP